MDEAGIKKMEKEVRGLVDEAVEFSKTSPDPDLNEMYTQVLVDNPTYIRGTDGIYGHGKCSWAPGA